MDAKMIKILFLSLTIVLVHCELSENDKKIVEGNNQQGFSVFKKIVEKENGNIVYSPLSAQTVLAMTYLGARENSAKEMSKTLYLPADQKVVGDSFTNILPHLAKDSDNFTLQMVNKMYPDQSIQILDSYIKDLENFNSTLEQLDFSKSAEAAEKINAFVKEQTHDRIKDLIEPSSLNGDTKLVLVNTIYFKAKWENQFSYYSESKMDFHLSNGETKKVDAISRDGHFGYKESDELKAKILEVNYVDTNYAMYFVLPNDVNGLKHVENNLPALAKIANEKFDEKHVSVSLPKFKIDYKIDLNDVLKSLGMTEVFTEKANFSGISSLPLLISKVAQKAFISVDEDGTEAAAASYVQMVTLSFDSEEKNFSANHPFLYYIQEKTTKTILFLGRFEQPN